MQSESKHYGRFAPRCKGRPGPSAKQRSGSTQNSPPAAGRKEHQSHVAPFCTDPFFNSQSKQIAAEAIHYKIPTIYQFREFAAAVGLMSYGGSGTNGFRQAGLYAGRILRAEKAADLPVQQETKAELVVNLKTAKTLGIDVPPMLLARAPKHSSKARH
jgi:ABC-type uncharacterized transport system substrate-binding protein